MDARMEWKRNLTVVEGEGHVGLLSTVLPEVGSNFNHF